MGSHRPAPHRRSPSHRAPACRPSATTRGEPRTGAGTRDRCRPKGCQVSACAHHASRPSPWPCANRWAAGAASKPVTRLERLERRERRQKPVNGHTEGDDERPDDVVVAEKDKEKTRTAAAAQAKAVANKPPAIPT